MGKSLKNSTKSRFDWEMLKLFTGIGVVSGGLGALLFWATYTAPANGGTESFALTTTQRLARMLPDDIKSKLAMIIAGLFILFGAFLLLTAVYRTLRYIFFRR